MDQLDKNSINYYWESLGDITFDFMIDDGLHAFKAGSTLFDHSIHKLNPNGIYIIEDVQADDMINYKNFFASKNFYVQFVSLFRPSIGLGDDNLIVIRNHL